MATEDMNVEGVAAEGSLEATSPPDTSAKRWRMEISLASALEKDWRKQAEEAYKIYAPKVSQSNSFNILWANTETMQHANCNSTPQPIISRRYTEGGDIALAAASVLQRVLEITVNSPQGGLLKPLRGDALAWLLAGRATSRVRYVPEVSGEMGEETETEENQEHEGEFVGGQIDMELLELEQEYLVFERVQWDDLRIGPGKVWDEVPWVAFRLQLSRDRFERYFGKDKADDISWGTPEGLNSDKDSPSLRSLFQTTEVWEIWCKVTKKVYFIPANTGDTLREVDDPMGLSRFFPIPEPLYAIQRDNTLVPYTLFAQYREQSKELNRITQRINKLVECLKLRGIFDSTMKEIAQLVDASDGVLLPVENATLAAQMGGLEKFIWFLPIEQCANVLANLYQHRESCKQIIYEITGISDIMRAATQASETLGAQELKTRWGSQRLKRMQQEMQRYARELLEIAGEAVAKNFSLETLQRMTQFPFPTREQVEQAAEAAQQQAAIAQASGAPPPQPFQPPPFVWEDIIELFRNDLFLHLVVNLETDSTIAESQMLDLEDFSKVLGALSQVFTAFQPLIDSGALPVDVVKGIALQVARKSRMGSAVEAAIDKIKQPPPPPDPNAAAIQLEQEKGRVKVQLDAAAGERQKELETFKAQLEERFRDRELQLEAAAESRRIAGEEQLARWQQEMQSRDAQHQAQLEAALKRLEMQHESREAQLDRDASFTLEEMRLKGSTGQTVVKEIGASQRATLQAETSLASAAAKPAGDESSNK